jgi:hypothetical protein
LDIWEDSLKNIIGAIDEYVESAWNLCRNNNAETAYSFWSAQRRVAQSAIAHGNPSWEVIRAIVVERHGQDAVAALSEAAKLRSKYFAAPPAGAGSSAPSGSGSAGRRKRHPER